MSNTDEIQRLNDAFRTGRSADDIVVVTSGIQSIGPEFCKAALAAVRAFSDFNPDNDPYLEHDFGALEIKGQRLFFKLDYYDRMRPVSPL